MNDVEWEMDYNIILENWLKKCIKSLTQSTIHFSLSLNKKGREYFLADKIPNSPRGTKCSKIEKKVQFQKCKKTLFAFSKMAKNQFLHKKKV